MDYTGPSDVSIGIDGQQVALDSFQYGFYDPRVCVPPLGNHHQACNPMSGFAASLDTRQLTDGWHTLQVVAVDRYGWTTSSEREIFVDNAPRTLSFSPTDDAYVKGDPPYLDSNFGSTPDLYVRSWETDKPRYSYLKFTVSGIQGTVTSARLRLHTLANPIANLSLWRLCSASWQESTLTWNNAPTATCSPPLTLYNLAPQTWHELDVSTLVGGDGVYSFALSSSDTGTFRRIYSKEGSFPAVLEITYQP
jgi:hypothetical protein